MLFRSGPAHHKTSTGGVCAAQKLCSVLRPAAAGDVAKGGNSIEGRSISGHQGHGHILAISLHMTKARHGLGTWELGQTTGSMPVTAYPSLWLFRPAATGINRLLLPQCSPGLSDAGRRAYLWVEQVERDGVLNPSLQAYAPVANVLNSAGAPWTAPRRHQPSQSREGPRFEIGHLHSHALPGVPLLFQKKSSKGCRCTPHQQSRQTSPLQFLQPQPLLAD